MLLAGLDEFVRDYRPHSTLTGEAIEAPSLTYN
jgi:hypothetical protein